MVTGVLLPPRLVIDPRESLDLAPIVNLDLIKLMFQRLELRRLGNLLDIGLVIVGLESAIDVFGFIDEIENERRIFAGDHAV